MLQTVARDTKPTAPTESVDVPAAVGEGISRRCDTMPSVRRRNEPGVAHPTASSDSHPSQPLNEPRTREASTLPSTRSDAMLAAWTNSIDNPAAALAALAALRAGTVGQLPPAHRTPTDDDGAPQLNATMCPSTAGHQSSTEDAARVAVAFATVLDGIEERSGGVAAVEAATASPLTLETRLQRALALGQLLCRIAESLEEPARVTAEAGYDVRVRLNDGPHAPSCRSSPFSRNHVASTTVQDGASPEQREENGVPLHASASGDAFPIPSVPSLALPPTVPHPIAGQLTRRPSHLARVHPPSLKLRGRLLSVLDRSLGASPMSPGLYPTTPAGQHAVLSPHNGSGLLKLFHPADCFDTDPHHLLYDDDLTSVAAEENDVQIARSQRAQFREDGGFEMINDYMILDELGRGATGAVYLAIHQTTDEPYAIKSLAKVKQRRLLMQQRRASTLSGGACVGASSSGLGRVKDVLRQHRSSASGAASIKDELKQLNTEHGGGSPSIPPQTDGTSLGATTARVKTVVLQAPPTPSKVAPSALRQKLDAQSSNPIEQEIAIMKSLKHPNLVTLHEVIDDDEDQQIHLVMDYCRYGPLLKMHGPSAVPSRKGSFMSPKSARAQKPAGTSALTTSVVRPISKLALYAGQMCSGLRYLHKLNIVHRDIKPDNILVAEDDLVKITDFGESAITAILDDDGAELGGPHQHKATVGTPAFFAPELCAVTRTGDTTPAAAVKLCSTTGKEADVWALGVTLYAALVGKLPFHGGTLDEQCRAIVNDKLTFPPLRELPENAGMSDLVYAYWQDALGSMLQKRPADRTSLKALSHHPCIVGPTDASKTILRRIEVRMHQAMDASEDALAAHTCSCSESQMVESAQTPQSNISQSPPPGSGYVAQAPSHHPGTAHAPSPPKQQRNETTSASVRLPRQTSDPPIPFHPPLMDVICPRALHAPEPGDVPLWRHPSDSSDGDDDVESLQSLIFGSKSSGACLSSRSAARVMFVSEHKRRAVLHQATALGLESVVGTDADFVI